MKQGKFIALEDEYCAPNYNPLPVVLSRGRGVWVWDTHGRKYLDMLAGYSALNLGHRHPRIERALKKQAGRLTLTSRAFRNDQLGCFSKELAEFCGMEMVLPVNTGAEAVETAIKACRRWGYQKKNVIRNKAEIIVCDNGFHGRSITLTGISSYGKHQKDFGPFSQAGFISIPFNDLDALGSAITSQTVAFLVEPIQGEWGIIVPDEGYIRNAKEICKKENVLLVLDEIQTGFGRTGRLFACDHDGVRPDILIVGKTLGGGMVPVSAVVGPREVLGCFTPGSHGSTFGGNPLALSIAREVLRVFRGSDMPANASRLGDYFLARLAALPHPPLKEVRGRGLMIGIELQTGFLTAREFCDKLLEERILAKETHDTVVRLTPPLTIEKKHLDWAYERIKKILR